MPHYKKLRPLTSKEYELILRLIKQGFKYHEIVAQVQSQLSSSVKTCHIAQVKRETGIGTRKAWNTGKRYTLSSHEHHEPEPPKGVGFHAGHRTYLS